MSITRYATKDEAQSTGGFVSWEPATDGKHWQSATGDDVPASASTREITTEAFRDRFTRAELLGVVSSSDTAIKCALLKLSTKERPVISLDNPEVVATVDRLVTLGLLSPSRAAAILA